MLINLQIGTFQCGIVYLHKPVLSGKVLIVLFEFRSKTRISVASTSVQCTGGIQFNEVIKNNKIYKGWKEKQHYHYWQVILLHIEEYINSKRMYKLLELLEESSKITAHTSISK